VSFHIRPVKKTHKKKNTVQKALTIGALSFILFVVLGGIYVVAQFQGIIESYPEIEENSDTGTIDTQVEKIKDCSILGCTGDMIISKGCNIKTENDRTNILLMGMGGFDHESQGGQKLTDTIMVVSLSHEHSTVSAISIPRDLWVKPPKVNPTKINTLFDISSRYYGGNRFGYILPKSTIEQITGLPIHYYAVIDFKGFVDVIDALGGVTVDVKNDFTDKQYPDGKYGYMTLNFEKGKQQLNGETALQYVRSRHGSNGESGDFARSRRQQNLIFALKDKAMSFQTIFKIDDISEAIFKNYVSNIQSCEVIRFASLTKDFDFNNIRNLTLDDGPGGVLYTPTQEVRDMSYDGQYILLPDGNNYNFIRTYITNFINAENVQKFDTKVAVLNGTGIEGLANQIGALLISNGLEIVKRGNTNNRTRFQTTTLYDVTGGSQIDAVEKIQELVGGKLSATNPEPLTHGADVILVLGADYKKSELLEGSTYIE